MYKGTKGFEFIKKYRSRRRHESRQYRQSSLGAMGKIYKIQYLIGSVRSRNKSSDGFFTTFRSCSSDVQSIGSKERKNTNFVKGSATGFFTRNRLNAKYMEITQAKKQRLQKSLNKVMQLHVGHADFSNPLSRKSSHTPCESVLVSSQNKEQ